MTNELMIFHDETLVKHIDFKTKEELSCFRDNYKEYFSYLNLEYPEKETNLLIQDLPKISLPNNEQKKIN